MTTYRTTPWRHLRDQLRLTCAEMLLNWCVTLSGWAGGLAPADHPDSGAIHKAEAVILTAAQAVATRRPTKADWRPEGML